ncbi:MAG TPA: hypothetical protein VIJ99_09205 [Acidimicrobiales bacterium]
MTRPRRHFWLRLSRVLVPAVTAAVLFSVGGPVGASTSSSVALRIADYAVATAKHDNPSHVVTAADVSNAAGISTVNTASLDPIINLGDVFGYARLVLFFGSKGFTDTCVNFPATVGGTPKVIPCPHQAQGLWDSRAGALAVSNRAIAAAAANGRAVSGADVVAAAKVYHETLRRKPAFLAGQGGKVEFTTLVEMGLNTKFTVNNCVQLPKTAFGIPVSVPC